MLVHQHMATEGSSGNAVAIPEGANFTNMLLASGTTFSGVIFASSGSVFRLNSNGSSSTYIGPWLLNGSASSFTLQRTETNGSLNGDEGPGWLALTSNRRYDVQETSQPNSATVLFEISDDGGATVLVSFSYKFQINV